jgi:hypothetical protein
VVRPERFELPTLLVRSLNSVVTPDQTVQLGTTKKPTSLVASFCLVLLSVHRQKPDSEGYCLSLGRIWERNQFSRFVFRPAGTKKLPMFFTFVLPPCPSLQFSTAKV